MSSKPIIIQNFFRSGGSYIYNLFNSNPNTLGFYEPFHESLSSVEKLKNEKNNFFSNKNKLRHSNKEFYFQNFPINDTYIQKFNSNIFNRYIFLLKRSDTSECINYLNYLISLANKNNKIPIFKINRLYLNPEILNKINSFKIFLFRDPISTFWSNVSLNLLNPYYHSLKFHYQNNIAPLDKIFELVKKYSIKPILLKNNSYFFPDKKNINFHFSMFLFVYFLGLELNFKNKFFSIYYNNLSNFDYSKLISKKLTKEIDFDINFYDFKKSNLKLNNFNLELIPEIKNLINVNIDLNIINENLSSLNIDENFKNILNMIK